MTKIALITGCSSGIGRYCARLLNQRDNWRVFATARNDDDKQRLHDEGIADVLHLDLDNPDSIDKAIAKMTQQTDGRIDVLFNNGAYGQPGAVEDLTRDALRAQFETNVFGTQQLTNAVIPLMRKQQSGRVIYNSSVLGFVCLKYRGAYNASKYAIEALADTMRMELSDTAIKVILLEPGPIASDFRKNAARAFANNINAEQSAHRLIYQQMQTAWQKENAMKFTLGPDAVYRAFLRAIDSSHPKIRYRITTPTVVLWYLKRILPIKWMDAILSRGG